MKKLILVLLAWGIHAGVAQAAPVQVGTYTLNALVDQVVSASGDMYNGVAYVDPVVSPGDITDAAAYTFLSTADFDGWRSRTLGLGFSSSQPAVVNGSGADIALFFLSDQSGNSANVTINGITKALSFGNVYDEFGVQQVVDGVYSAGVLLDNVLLQVADVDLSDFGFAPGDLLGNNALNVGMYQTAGNSVAVSLALVGATNVTAVPVPAALWLFGCGLLGLVGVAKRTA